MTIRVLYIVAEPIPFGPSQQASIVARELAPEFDVDQVCMIDSAATWHAEDARYTQTYLTRPGNVLGSALWLRRALCAKKYALVHSWEPRANELLSWVLATITPTARPAIWLTHLGDDELNASRTSILGLPRPDGSTADSWTAAVRVTDMLSGIPMASTKPAAALGVLRAAAGTKPDTILIGSVCPLEARHGLRNLIWSLDQLKCIGRDVRLVVWGRGSDRAALERYARLSSIDDWILWRDPRGNVSAELAELDFYWQAPASQPTPAALVAALLRGIPSVAPISPSTESLARRWPTLLRTVAWGDRVEYTRHTFDWLEHGAPTADPAIAESYLVEFGPAAAAQALAELYRQRLASNRQGPERQTNAGTISFADRQTVSR